MYLHRGTNVKANGFTLIELIIVILILGILSVTAAPKFFDMSKDAKASVVQGTGAAFGAAVRLIHQKVILEGGGPIDNLQVFGDQVSGQLDINQWGYPAQHWTPFESSPRLDNSADCISVWQTILEDAPSVSVTADVNTSDYRAVYLGNGTCRYDYNDLSQLSITYDSEEGSVTIDSDYSS